MQLVARPGGAGVPTRVAEHGKEHRELAEQGNTGKGQWRFVSVAGHVVGYLLRGLGFVYRPGRSLPIGTGMHDDACSLGPRFVGWEPVGGHPEIAGMAKIGAEGLPRTTGKIVL